MSSAVPKEHAVVDEESASGEGKKREHWVPFMLSTPITVALCVVLIGVAMGLELILWKSHKHNGFSSISFTNLSASEASQFLKSFLPNLIFVPILYVMRNSYQELKVVQPYVELSRGSAPPEYSITSSYASDR
ncbi:hypothetical protein DL93DRAFT_2174269 [Clavulina sp. PMI_390]|nr:hypothetical protein DL93DRAFT_2174269 [Clavulina sp. PMI_390]